MRHSMRWVAAICGVLLAAPVMASAPSVLERVLADEFVKTGWLPPGARVVVSSVTSQDPELLAGKEPQVELRGRSWTSNTLTAKLVSGPRDTRRTGWVRFSVQVTAPVIVATRDLLARQNIDRRDLRVTRRRIQPRQQTVTSIQSLVGRSLRRSIRSGKLLDTRWLAPDAASRGDNVSGRLRQGALTLRFTLTLLQRGQVGQVVRAQVANTGKVVRARLLSKSEAEVIL